MKKMNALTNNRIKLVFLFFLFSLLIVSNAYAFSYGKGDYGDAPGYGWAMNGTGEWQRLGTAWDSEWWPRTDDGDDGVFWSVNGGAWGHDGVAAGDTVVFGFQMTRASYGSHEYDALKAWVDWDQNGVWDNVDEQVIGLQWFKSDDPGVYVDFFTTEELVIPEIEGDLWLRARVTCDHTQYADVNPYNTLQQGETEDWKLTVTNKPVPEPATMMLLGVGMTGMGLVRRVRRRLAVAA